MFGGCSSLGCRYARIGAIPAIRWAGPKGTVVATTTLASLLAGFAAALAAVTRGLGNLGQHASLPAAMIDDVMKSLSIFRAPE